MANATILVHNVCDVDGITRLSMAATEVVITGTIRSLHTDDEAVYVQHDTVLVDEGSVLWVLQRDGELLVLGWLW